MARGSIVSIGDLIKHDYLWAVDTAKEVNDHQLGWWFVVDYPVATITKRIQVRNIRHLAPVREVNEYAQMMKLGDQFPPVIITHDGWLVDGHTRTEAAKKIHRDAVPAIVLNVNYGNLDADSPVRKTLLALGAAMNNRHGRRMTPTDIAGLIEQVAPGSTPKQIQRDMHVGASLANVVWNARRTKDKASELGIPLTGEMNNSMLRLFGGKIDKYTNPVWGRLLHIAQDAHLSVPQINDLMKRVETLPDEDARVRFLETERDAYSPAIRTGSRVTPPHARRVKQGLGYLLKEDLAPDALAEKDPAKMQDYVQVLMESREKIDKVIYYQEQLIEAARTHN